MIMMQGPFAWQIFTCFTFCGHKVFAQRSVQRMLDIFLELISAKAIIQADKELSL